MKSWRKLAKSNREKVEDIKSIKNMIYRWISKKILSLHTFQTICNIFQNLTFLTFVTFIFAQGQNYVIHDPEWEIYSVSFLALGR